MNAAQLLRGAGNALVAVTIAPRCASCARVLERPLDGAICVACWSAIHPLVPPLCRICGGMLPSWRTISLELERCPSCRRRPGTIDAGRAVGEYEGTLREIVHVFKYEGRRSLGTRLGHMLRSSGAELLSSAQCVVPVPLHPWRRLRRGFNQADVLSRVLGPPVIHALWRIRATAPQTGLAAFARRRNVRGAFRLSPLVRRRVLRSYVIDRTVILVDDVWTTGATLDECARVLKAAGAREVRALTVARAAPPRRA